MDKEWLFSRNVCVPLEKIWNFFSENEYDLIVKEIKKNCKYYDIITYTSKDDEELDYVSYSCSESKYKGKIGFMISEGWGYIWHFILD